MALELETELNPNLATFTLREAASPFRSKDCTTPPASWSDHRQEGPPAYQTLAHGKTHRPRLETTVHGNTIGRNHIIRRVHHSFL